MNNKACTPLLDILTSSKHTLHKIPDVTENDSEAFCNALLACQRFDLYTLKNRLLHSIVWIVENGTIWLPSE